MYKQFLDLAVFSGKPLFPEPLHVGRPNIGNRQRLLERINDMLDRRWLTNAGYYVKEFEAKVADLLGVKHCVAMCNGTVALEIAVRALGMQGEVVVPSFTFVATAHCLQWQEITPVFGDIDPATCNIDPAAVENLITPRTTGIIGVHLWGRPCNIEELERIAQQHNLELLFDASHAFGCTYRDKMIGVFGQAEVFSFHGTKLVNAFEGGAVVTDNDELADKMRLMKNFGFKGMDNVIYLGTNGKMSEASAIMGLTSLESLEEFIDANRNNYHEYQRGLANIPGIHLMTYDESEKNNFQYVVLRVDQKEAGLNRDVLLKILQAESVLARRYFYPGCHRMEPYRSYYPQDGLSLRATEELCECVLCLPTGTTVNQSDIQKICRIIQIATENGVELSRRLDELKN